MLDFPLFIYEIYEKSDISNFKFVLYSLKVCKLLFSFLFYHNNYFYHFLPTFVFALCWRILFFIHFLIYHLILILFYFILCCRITVAVFSMLKTTLQIWLNGQLVLTHEYVGEDGEINHGFRDLRHKHTDGEVTCVSTEQYVSLPANSLIG